MTELAPTTVDHTPSTELNPAPTPQNPSGYKPDAAPEKEAPKPLSARQALEKAAEDAKLTEAKPEKAPEKKAEPQKEQKAELSQETEQAKPDRQRSDDGKFAAKAQEPSEDDSEVAGKVAETAAQETRSSEVRDTKVPPPGFLPRAREKWGTVDPDVQSEMYRALDNFEKGKAEYQEDREFRKSIKPYEEMAKQFGTSVPNYLENTLRINQYLSQDIVGGLDHLARQFGYSLEQIAQHVLGQAQQQQQNPQSAHTQRLEQQINQLNQQIQQLTQGTQQDREAARVAEIERSVIAPFREAHPRYAELERDIVFFLNSDRIPSNLSERQRLETAYDMAERINPAPVYSQERVSPAPESRPLNPAGKKSIKGTPTSADLVGKDKGKLSPRDAIRAAAAEHGIHM